MHNVLHYYSICSAIVFHILKTILQYLNDFVRENNIYLQKNVYLAPTYLLSAFFYSNPVKFN